MKLRTLNFIILTSAVVVFIGAGCGQTSKNEVTSSVNVGNQVVEEEGEEAQDLEEEAEETVTEGSVEEIDTSDWLTYENEEYGFSFRYPKDWNAKELEEGGLGTDKDDIIINNNSCNIYISIPHEKDDQITAVKRFNDSLITGKFGSEQIVVDTIGSVTAIKYVNTNGAYGTKGEVYKFVIADQLFTYILNYDVGNEGCITFSNDVMSTFEINS